MAAEFTHDPNNPLETNAYFRAVNGHDSVVHIATVTAQDIAKHVIERRTSELVLDAAQVFEATEFPEIISAVKPSVKQGIKINVQQTELGTKILESIKFEFVAKPASALQKEKEEGDGGNDVGNGDSSSTSPCSQEFVNDFWESRACEYYLRAGKNLLYQRSSYQPATDLSIPGCFLLVKLAHPDFPIQVEIKNVTMTGFFRKMQLKITYTEVLLDSVFEESLSKCIIDQTMVLPWHYFNLYRTMQGIAVKYSTVDVARGEILAMKQIIGCQCHRDYLSLEPYLNYDSASASAKPTFG